MRHLLYKGVWPTSPRDFAVITTWNDLADGSILISSKSAPDEICPLKQGYVRGVIKVSGYHIKPLPHDSKTCEVTLCAHTDLGGSLPSSLINALSSVAPMKQLSAIAAIISNKQK